MVPSETETEPDNGLPPEIMPEILDDLSELEKGIIRGISHHVQDGQRHTASDFGLLRIWYDACVEFYSEADEDVQYKYQRFRVFRTMKLVDGEVCWNTGRPVTLDGQYSAGNLLIDVSSLVKNDRLVMSGARLSERIVGMKFSIHPQYICAASHDFSLVEWAYETALKNRTGSAEWFEHAYDALCALESIRGRDEDLRKYIAQDMELLLKAYGFHEAPTRFNEYDGSGIERVLGFMKIFDPERADYIQLVYDRMKEVHGR